MFTRRTVTAGLRLRSRAPPCCRAARRWLRAARSRSAFSPSPPELSRRADASSMRATRTGTSFVHIPRIARRHRPGHTTATSSHRRRHAIRRSPIDSSTSASSSIRSGEVILHRQGLAAVPRRHSVCPHDIYDWWVERYGEGLDAFWPVVDTDIGRLGIMMANEGSYPENARALALNGAEVVDRARHASGYRQRATSRSRPGAPALDNNLYVVRPTWAPTTSSPRRTRRSTRSAAARSSWTTRAASSAGRTMAPGRPTSRGVIDIEALRYHRARRSGTTC